MNYSAIILLFIGLGIAIVGLTGSQKVLCEIVLGGKCDWMPGNTSTTKTS